MVQTKPTFSPGQTPEQRKAQAAYARQQDAAVRKFNDLLSFWLACGKPVCRRRRSCTSDVQACFRRHWELVPEEEKEYWRGCFKAARSTRVPEEMHRAGVAARDACLQDQERTAALLAASAPAAPVGDATPGSDAPPRPRIRRL